VSCGYAMEIFVKFSSGCKGSLVMASGLTCEGLRPEGLRSEVEDPAHVRADISADRSRPVGQQKTLRQFLCLHYDDNIDDLP
jgi:hypothetical protein